MVLSDVVESNLLGGVEGDSFLDEEESWLALKTSVKEVSQVIRIIDVDETSSLFGGVIDVFGHLDETVFFCWNQNASGSQVIQSESVFALEASLNGVVLETVLYFGWNLHTFCVVFEENASHLTCFAGILKSSFPHLAFLQGIVL